MTAARVLVSTSPFASEDPALLSLLDRPDIECVMNPLGRRLTELELMELVKDVDILIAGTEPITASVLERAQNLKLISRVGIGLDSVDLCESRARGIAVTYTPDAPSTAVAELTVGLVFCLLRSIHVSNLRMRSASWTRHFGESIEDVSIGIVGVGRIGSRVAKMVTALGARDVVACDPQRELEGLRLDGVRWSTHDELYRSSDVISLHVPLTRHNRGMIGTRELSSMRPSVCLINTSRGGVVNEQALLAHLDAGGLGAVALDVFENEPYEGPLTSYDRVLLTAHMGSMTRRSRKQMEWEATMDVLRFLEGDDLQGTVPDTEYDACLES